MITIGSVVSKKSGKPFQNKEKTAVVTGVSSMTIPVSHWLKSEETQEVECVMLEGCTGCVATSGLEVIDVQS